MLQKQKNFLGEFKNTVHNESFCKTKISQIFVCKDVNVFIRPEVFRVTYDPKGNFKVLSIEFRGMYSIVHVQSVNHGFLLKFILNDKDQLWSIGSNVNLIKATTSPLIVYSVN